jgi:hypothetical protein
MSSEKQQQELAIMTIRTSGLLKQFGNPADLTNECAHVIQKFKDKIGKLLNDHRSYCQTSMKDVCMTYMQDKKVRELPPNEEFLKIITHDPTVDMDLFAWWWSKYMPKAAGTAKAWNQKIKYFGLLSAHAPPGRPHEKYITPSTEAWGLLLIQNCRTRWPKIMALKANSSNKITYTKGSFRPKKSGIQHVNIASDPGFVGKYTKADAGQQKFGG